MDADITNHACTRASNGGIQRLLVIDDDTVHRMVLARIGRQAGYEVDEAATYEAACLRLAEGAYSCATVDLSLGNHGGVEVLQHMARIGYTAPVVMVTGSEGDVRRDAFEVACRLGLNVCEPFAKPVKLAILRQLLNEIHKRQVVGLTARVA